MNTDVDFYFAKGKKWQSEMSLLRKVISGFPLTEELKWGVPCYTMSSNTSGKKSNNVLLIHAFKEYCAILFIKGALLKDTDKLLVQQTENVQAGRQIRFTDEEEVLKLTSSLKVLIKEAIEVEKSGLKVKMNKTSTETLPEELKAKFREDPDFKLAFDTLTPGRQRGYILYFSQPKQTKTRISRIAKCIPNILDGKGLQDK